jgi:hypothetical protein
MSDFHITIGKFVSISELPDDSDASASSFSVGGATQQPEAAIRVTADATNY